MRCKNNDIMIPCRLLSQMLLQERQNLIQRRLHSACNCRLNLIRLVGLEQVL